MSRCEIPAEREAAGAAEAFWRYALTLYGAPGVAPACLTLQDEADADVNMILLMCWLAECGWPPLSEPLIGRLKARVADWRAEVIVPLRRLRRRLKAGQEDELYRAAKACELAAERAEIAALAEEAMALEAEGAVVRSAGSNAEKRRTAGLSLAVYLAGQGVAGTDGRVAVILNAAFPPSA